jgi:hypothetical protein
VAKAEKTTVEKRVQDVARLICVGADFPDIQRFAEAHHWNISERQLRRYTEKAHEQFRKLTEQDRQQLLGRHLAQRKSIFAQAMKSGDHRTALQALKDEATLEGFYSPQEMERQVRGERMRQYLAPSRETNETRRSRTVRLLMAQAKHDNKEEKLVGEETPRVLYEVPDTTFPLQMLHTMALIYANEQLEYAGLVANARGMVLQSSEATEGEHALFWLKVILIYSYMFKVGREGWELFCNQIEIDGELLVGENYQGVLLEMLGDNVVGLAPSAEEVRKVVFEEVDGECREESAEAANRTVITAESKAKAWRMMFIRASKDVSW